MLDNLCNGSWEALHRVEAITGNQVVFIEVDVRDRMQLGRLFDEHAIEAVIHFDGLKAVGVRVEQPLDYYDANVHGSLVLCQAMAAAGLYKLAFSSSATVYGPDSTVPYVETMPRGRASNPYGSTKAMVEQPFTGLSLADARWLMAHLRYFDSLGATPPGRSVRIRRPPNNLMPFIAQVAVGRPPELAICADDYPNEDGTCIREDLAGGCLA